MGVNFDKELTPAQRRDQYTRRTNLTNVPRGQAGSSWTGAQMDYLRDAVIDLLSLVQDAYEGGTLVSGSAREDKRDADAIVRHKFLMAVDPAYVARFLYESDTPRQAEIDASPEMKALLSVYPTVSAAHQKWAPSFVATKAWIDDRKAEYDLNVRPPQKKEPFVQLAGNYLAQYDYGLSVTVV